MTAATAARTARHMAGLDAILWDKADPRAPAPAIGTPAFAALWAAAGADGGIPPSEARRLAPIYHRAFLGALAERRGA